MLDEDDFSEASLADSDVELQEAFARGDLKPGLVVLEKHTESKDVKTVAINNVPRLQALLKQMKLPSSFAWPEKLDVISGLAPLAPEIAVQLNEHREKREKEIHIANSRKKKKKGPVIPTLKPIDEDPIHNDFQRELNFHRQAQSAIMTCLPKLQALGIPTKRPEDYFAEMAKTDEHMQKVASVLLKKQTSAEKAEKVRKVRDQKKIAKQTQIQVMQERHKAKRELIDSVKKYRKGQKNSLDFLEERKAGGASGGRGGRSSNGNGTGSRKRELKNERYGYGGKKSGAKRNTRDSLDNVPSRGFRGGGGGGRGGGGRGGRGGGGGRLGNMSRGGPSSFGGGGGGGRLGNMGRGGPSSFGGGGGGGRLGNMGRGGPSSFGGGGGGMSSGRGRGGRGRGGMTPRGGGGRGGGSAKRPGKSNRIKSKARSSS